MKILKDLILKCSLLLLILAPAATFSVAYAASSDSACDNTADANGVVDNKKVAKCLNQSPVVKDIQDIVNFLSAAVGLVIIGAIIVGGIQYSLAGDNSSALESAKKRITNAMIALFAFLFAYAFMQWLIPGGIFP